MPHHLNIPDRLGTWILSHRALVLFIFAVITAVTGWGSTRVPIKASILEGLMTNHDRHAAYTAQVRHLGGSSDDMLYIATKEGDELFTAKTLDAIRVAANDMRELPFVARVLSITDVPRFDTTEPTSRLQRAFRNAIRSKLAAGDIDSIPIPKSRLKLIWPESARRGQVDLSKVQSEMKQHPIARRLLSRDGNAQVMLVWLDSSLRHRPSSGVRRQLEAILKSHGLGREESHFAGTLVVQDWMFDEVLRTLQVVLPVTALLVSLLTMWVFHRLSYVFLTLVIAAVAATWSVGITAWIFGEITLLVAAVPALVMVISTADTIHLVSAYVAELVEGKTREVAIQQVFKQVGGACVLTSVTTFVGFMSLLVVPAAAVRHLAIGCAIGVTSALLLALTLVPMALQILNAPPVETRSLLNHWMDRCVGWCQWASLNRPRTVVGFHVVFIALATLGAMQIYYDADLPARFPRKHPLRQSVEFFNDQVFATSTIEIMIETEPNKLLSPELLRGLAEFEHDVRKFREVSDVLSLLDLFRVLDEAIDFQTRDGLPRSQTMAESCVRLAERHAGDAAAMFVSSERGLTRIAIQVPSTRVVQAWEFSKQLIERAEACLPSGTKVEAAGYYPVVGEAVVVVVESQIEGFYLCFACVMAIVSFGVRSIRLSLLAVMPNLLPLVFLGGILGVLFEMVDSDVIGIAIISFGLAVDDTIHFLHRYDIEFSQSGNKRQALEQTFRYTGSAIIRTTVILGVGLLPFGLSDYLSTRLLGSFLVVVLAFAVFGDLLLLPSLVLLFGRKEDGRDHTE